MKNWSEIGGYSYVEFSCNCPNCGYLLKNFQTKDTRGDMKHYLPSHPYINNFYKHCINCRCWIEFYKNPKIKGKPGFRCKLVHIKYAPRTLLKLRNKRVHL